jgi:hypothetical protein
MVFWYFRTALMETPTSRAQRLAPNHEGQHLDPICRPIDILHCCSITWISGRASSSDSEREKDVYLIYSLMLTNLQTSHGPDDNERYLIAGTTASGRSPVPCVVPPKDRVAVFREIIADYEGRKAQLKPMFSIRKPYLLLNTEEVNAFMTDRRLTPEPKLPDARFRGVSDVFTLSEVFFNQRRTLALSAISSWCGLLCGQYQCEVFEKRKTGHWEERPWLRCSIIASDFRTGR